MQNKTQNKIGQRRYLRIATALLLTLLLCCGLTGCQTSQMKETQTDTSLEQQTATATKKAETKTPEKEEDYIDESYVDDNYDAEEDEDLAKYNTDKKSQDKTSSSKGKGKDTAAPTDSTQDGQDTETAQDEYNTDPVPEGNPEPVEPQDVDVDASQSLSCTLYVECSTILDNMDDLAEGKESLVPSDGVIYGPTSVIFYEGESVYDVLLREMQNNRIHMDAEFTAANNSSYIKAINNLYERDCGNLSGWRYSVNGWYPNYGCSRYQIQDGDAVELHYTCDLGRDLDGDVPEGN